MKKIISIWLKPQPSLSKEIFEIIKEFSKKYKVYSDLNSYKGPHITISELYCDILDFEKLVKLANGAISGIKPFNLEIDGIGYFKKKDKSGNPNFVIYLRIKKNKQLMRLKNKLDKQVPKEFLGEKRRFVPHISITHRELDKAGFYHALKEYKNLDFVRKFIVDGIQVSKYDSETKKPTLEYLSFRK